VHTSSAEAAAKTYRQG